MTRLFCLLALALGTLAAQPQPAELFAQQADVFVDSSGLSLLELPNEVLTQAAADLSDLRLFDTQGAEVPYAAYAASSQDEKRNVFTPNVTALDRSTDEPERGQNAYREIYRLELPHDVSLAGQWTLEINTSLPEFVRRIDVDAVASGGDRTPLLRGAPLFQVNRSLAANAVFELPRFPSHVIEVKIEGQAAGYVEPTFILFQGRARAPRTVSETQLTILERIEGPHWTDLVLERPPAVVPTSLRFRTSTRTFVRRVSVDDRATGRQDEYLSSAMSAIVRLPGEFPLDRLDVDIRPAQGDRLVVRIINLDSPPLENLTVAALALRPALLFSLAPGAVDIPAGTLRFGGGRTKKPSYDLASLDAVLQAESARGVALEAPALARLGPFAANPNYAPQTLLSFASRPGADVDARTYTHVRPVQLEPSPEGLTRIELGVQDAAVSRPDFADLRLTDANSAQWAYLLDRSARQAWLPLAVAPGVTEDGSTAYRLTLPASVALIDRIRVTFPGAYYDRPYQLMAKVDGQDRLLSADRLAGSSGSGIPVEIEISAVRASELTLILFDGNDQPLPAPAVEGRFPLPDLYTVAPAGDYKLLLGFPDDSPPVYELAQASSTVLAARAGAATLGEVIENPLFSASSRLRTGPGSQRALFWIALLAAVGVLAVMTLKTVRGEAGGAS